MRLRSRLFLGGMLLTCGCTDAPTEGPALATSAEPRFPPTDGGLASPSFEPVQGGTVTLSVPSIATPAAQAALPGFTKKVLLRAQISGSVFTQLTWYNDGGPNSPSEPGAPRQFGPAGFFYHGTPPNTGCGGQVMVGYPSAGGGTSVSFACSSDRATDTLSFLEGYLYSAAVPPGGAPAPGSVTRSGGNPNLGMCASYRPDFTGYGPCFYYSGSQTVTIERATAVLSVTATPSQIRSGDTVTVTASVSPGAHGPLQMPWSIDSVRWVPSHGTQWPPC